MPDLSQLVGVCDTPPDFACVEPPSGTEKQTDLRGGFHLYPNNPGPDSTRDRKTTVIVWRFMSSRRG